MKNRSELPQIYCNFANIVHTQLSQRIKVFCTHNPMEYKETIFFQFLCKLGTMSQYYSPSTNQQNDCAKFKHHYILDTVWMLLLSSSCLKQFWGEATITVVYTINCMTMPIIVNQSSYDHLHGICPA